MNKKLTRANYVNFIILGCGINSEVSLIKLKYKFSILNKLFSQLCVYYPF